MAYSTKRMMPEEQELSRKRAELEEAEAQLAEVEAELSALRSELEAFEREYLMTVGACFAELDQIDAQISEVLAARGYRALASDSHVAKARARAHESSKALERASQREQPEADEANTLRSLYREVAKSMHPDLAADEEERARREVIMVEAIRAYKAEDAARLEAILYLWRSSPEQIRGEGVATELIRVIRKLARVQDQLLELHDEMGKLRQTDLYKLKTLTTHGQHLGRNMLGELNARLEARIAAARKRLALLTR